jgi:hypothetical protein
MILLARGVRNLSSNQLANPPTRYTVPICNWNTRIVLHVRTKRQTDRQTPGQIGRPTLINLPINLPIPLLFDARWQLGIGDLSSCAQACCLNLICSSITGQSKAQIMAEPL